jgi:hypothetical protein
MPSADSRPTVKMDRSILSHDAVTCGGSPEVNSTAFDAQPPDLPPVCLVEAGFAVLCQLAPHRRPLHPVLVHRLAPLIHASFRPRLATTPLRFSSPSPPPGWAGDSHPLAVEHVRHTKKKAAFARGLGTMLTRTVSLLLRRIGRGGLGCRRHCRLGGRRGRGLGSASCGLSGRRWRRGHTRLHVVGFDNWLGYIHSLAVPDHWSLWPRL